MLLSKFKIILHTLLVVILTLGFSISLQSLLAAWQAPTANPPDGNVSGPVYTSGRNMQAISGDITLSNGKLLTAGNIITAGTSTADKAFCLGTTNPSCITNWSNAGKTYTAGSGLNLTNNTFSLDTTNLTTGCGDATTGKVWWNGTKLVCATDQTGSGGGSGGLTGAGTANYIAKWTGGTSLGNSTIFETGGNVGIGTTNPVYKLDVNGNIRATQFCIGTNCISSWPSGSGSYTAGSGLNLTNNTFSLDTTNLTTGCGDATTGKVWWNGTKLVCATDQTGSGGGSGGLTGAGTANYIAKWTGGTSLGNSTIFETGGNVGIGTTNPTTKFMIQDNNITFSHGLLQGMYSNSTRAIKGIYVNGSDSFAVGIGIKNSSGQYAGVQLLDNSGRGITHLSWDNVNKITELISDNDMFFASNNPNAKFFIGHSGTPISGYRLTVTGNVSRNIAPILWRADDVSAEGFLGLGNFEAYGHPAVLIGARGITQSNIVFRTSNINRMTIDYNGNVGIGNTLTPAQKFSVAGNANINGIFVGKNSEAQSGQAGFVISNDGVTLGARTENFNIVNNYTGNYGKVWANDYYIGATGKWASQLGGGNCVPAGGLAWEWASGGTVCCPGLRAVDVSPRFQTANPGWTTPVYLCHH